MFNRSSLTKQTLQTVTVLLALCCFGVCISAQTIKSPPKTRTDNIKEVLHGVEVVDSYRWLEDKDSAETRAWIKEQNEYTHALLDSLPSRDLLRNRLTSLLKVDSPIFPQVKNGRYFYSRLIAGKDLSILYMKKSADSPEEVLLDPHTLSADHKTSAGFSAISEDGKLISYFIRQGGEDEAEYHFLDTDTRKELPDVLPKARIFGVSIRHDKAGFYYTRFEAQGPRVYYHTFGSDIAKDVELFGKGYGREKIIGESLSEDGRYLLITAIQGSSGKNELYFKDISKDGPITTIVNDLDADFNGNIIDNKMVMYTNWKAPNGRIMLVDLNKPTREHWQELIPEEKNAVYSSFSLVGKKLFVKYLENVSSRVKVFDMSGKYLRDIKFPTLGTVGNISGNWDSNLAFFSFTSFHIPTTVYQYDTDSGEYKVYSRLNVPIKEEDYVVKQEWYESKDHTRVPMFIVYPKGIKLDGSNPTILYGYGGFKSSLTPTFSTTAATWLSTGGIYVVANLRGGNEFGEDWHRSGMLEKKQNVFDDFIAAAEWLIKNRYTSSEKLAIYGGSNGGLLVGACMTQRPDLFRAVLCAVPLLDMVRYHKFLVARFWIPEYGSSEDANQFKYIYAYSPYHNVKAGTKYPATMFITGDADTRVDPLHARKMTALLQAETGSKDHPIILDYDTKAGHSGGKPVSQIIEDGVNQLSFLLWQLGANVK